MANREDAVDIVDDVIAQATAMASQQATGVPPIRELAGDNPLDQFASYTYNISLAALSPDEYNKLIKNPDISFVPQNVIIAGAARQEKDTFRRNEFFDREFYIQNLKFDTIVGLNAETRSSNVISVKMEVVEPMGLSFFDRLLRLAAELKYDNFIDIPYLLIIDFVGYDDQGVPQRRDLSEHRKFIPIKIISSNMKVNTTGAVYFMDAIPYNHIAYLSSDTGGSVPLNLQIKCQKVRDFFVGDIPGISVSTQLTERSQTNRLFLKYLEANQGDFSTTPVREWGVARTFAANLVSAPVKAGSFASALNEYESYINLQKLAKKQNTYNFRIDNEIAQANIVTKPASKTNQAPMIDRVGVALLGSFANLDTDAKPEELYGVTAGTNIIEVINSVIKNSSYVTNQLNRKQNNNPPSSTRPNGPLNWYKITPQVEIKDYDVQRESYSKNITYNINKYILHNTKSDTVVKTLPARFLIEYDYIFTGNNRSILDLQIEYDALFSVIASSSNSKGEFLTADTTSPGPEEHRDIFDRARFGDNITPRRIFVKSNFMNQRGNNSEAETDTIETTDFYNNLLNVSPDMMGVSMRIIGDPRYIKQDDVFYNASNSNQQFGQLLSQNNSILFDYEERYLKLNFKTPTDYNSETGLLDRDDRFYQSKFSGLYRILRIENTFTRGRFEQILDLVRLFLQDENGVPLKNRIDTSDVTDIVPQSLRDGR